MPVSADLDKLLDKAYEDKPLVEILEASPAALQGLTDKHAQVLHETFGIKTIGDMGRNKFFRWAQAMAALAEAAK